MRIAIVNTFFPPYRGGAETYSLNIAESLAKFGHEVEVFCSKSPYDERDVIELHPKVHLHRLRAPLKIYGTPIPPSLPSRLMNLEVDFLHVNFPNPYNALVGAYASKVRGVASVLTWHNDLPKVSKWAGILISIHDHLAPLYLRFYHRIVATTKAYCLTSRVISRFKDKVRIIHNGVDCSRFHPDNDGGIIRARYGIEEGRVILFVGALTRWHRYKGLEVLLKALRKVVKESPDVRLLVVGAGELKPYYEDLSRLYHLSDYILFAGDVPDSELPLYYAAAELLVLPSVDRSEGFGLVLLEANASGRPVVASRVGGIVEVVRDGHNGLLVEPLDAEGMAEAILLLLEDDELRREMGKKGRIWAERHDWSLVARELERVYMEAYDLAMGLASR